MKVRLQGTEAECARLTFLLRYGPPEVRVVAVQHEGPVDEPAHSGAVVVTLQVDVADVNPLVDRTFVKATRLLPTEAVVRMGSVEISGSAASLHVLSVACRRASDMADVYDADPQGWDDREAQRRQAEGSA